MSGLAGRFFTGEGHTSAREREALARSFTGPNFTPVSYADADALLVVASRFASADRWGSFGELTESERYALALEGYLLNLDDLAGAGALARCASRGALVLELLERHGPSLVRKLNGGFTLILWDKAERVAVVGSCNFGQRTLYRTSTGAGTTIASDLQALRQVSGRTFDLDRETTGASFLHGGVAGEATPLRAVTKVLPGSTLTLRRGAMTSCLARDIPHATGTGTRGTTAFHIEQLDALMRQGATRLGRVAPAHAVMLGSGVDSSLVAAYAKRAMTNVVAVTQQMPGETDESGEAARIVAALGIPQTIVPYEPRPGALLADVAAFVRIAEEPAYWNQLGPPLLRLLGALEQPPAAFLTGAEGDFLFHFRTGRRPSVRRVVGDGLFWPVARHTARRLVNRVTRHTYITGSDFDLLDREFMRQHVAPDAACPTGAPDYAHLPAGPNAQRHFIDNGWQNVRIISQFGHATGAEVLFPYLDDDVAACILALPDEMKINKELLRMLLAGFLPRRAVPTKKTGYWAHTIRWHYETGALGDVLDLLSEPRTLERGVYAPARVQALVDAYARGLATPRCHPVLWQLLLFETFCREFVDGPQSRN